jgi:hypothetical protein
MSTATVPEPSATALAFTLRYDTAQTAIELALLVKTAPTSVSEIYVSVHLPASANAAKSSVETACPSKVRGEVVYDQEAGGLLTILATAGATSVPWSGVLQTAQGPYPLAGTTGVPTTLSFAP